MELVANSIILDPKAVNEDCVRHGIWRMDGMSWSTEVVHDRLSGFTEIQFAMNQNRAGRFQGLKTRGGYQQGLVCRHTIILLSNPVFIADGTTACLLRSTHRGRDTELYNSSTQAPRRCVTAGHPVSANALLYVSNRLRPFRPGPLFLAALRSFLAALFRVPPAAGLARGGGTGRILRHVFPVPHAFAGRR